MTPPPKDPAKARFAALQLIRLIGAALAIIGLAAMAGKIALPTAAGAVLFVIGLFDLMAMPLILARRWRSPPQ